MLHEFLTTYRASLITRCRTKVASRAAPKATPAELDFGVPMFLDQLIAILRAEQARPSGFVERRAPFPRQYRGVERRSAVTIADTARRHGRELLAHGFTIDQVVRDYGDLCQAITGLAAEVDQSIGTEEFQTLNRCLDDAIAGAVTEFSARYESAQLGHDIKVSDERARALLEELAGHVQTATQAIAAVKAGNVGVRGATGAVIDLALISMRTLIERSLAEGSPTGGLRAHP